MVMISSVGAWPLGQCYDDVFTGKLALQTGALLFCQFTKLGMCFLGQRRKSTSPETARIQQGKLGISLKTSLPQNNAQFEGGQPRK